MSMVKREDTEIATDGAYVDARRANAALQFARDTMHLISPASSMGSMLAGCELVMSRTLIDCGKDGKSGDVYPTDGGKLGLSKAALEKIGRAAGITWDARASGRVDNGSHPYYCRWRAVARIRSLDGQWQTLVKEQELDLRDRSHNAETLKPNQLAQMRKFIQAHCETKAQLRVLRSLGLRSSYTFEELQKPFVSARLSYTGHSEDPATRREAAADIRRSFLSDSAMLYSEPVPMQDAQRLLPPPPVGSVREDSGEYETEYEAPASEPARGYTPPTKPAEPQQASFGDAAPAPTAAAGGAGDGKPKGPPPGANPGFVLKFGRSKDKTIGEAATKDLEWMRDLIDTNLENGESRYPDNDRKLLAALLAEISLREKGGL